MGASTRATARRWAAQAHATAARWTTHARTALGRRASRARALVARRLARAGARARAGASAAAAAIAAGAERLAYRRREVVLAALLAASLLGGLAVERARRLWPGLLERLETEPPPPALLPAKGRPAHPPRDGTARTIRPAPEEGGSAISRRTGDRGAARGAPREEGGALARRRRASNREGTRSADLAREADAPRRAGLARAEGRAEASRESRRLAHGRPAPRTPRAGAEAEGRDRRVARSTRPSEPLDVNRATAGELARLPGVERELAERIVAHREARGGFASRDDLRWIPGVGARRLARLAPYLAEPPPGRDGARLTATPAGDPAGTGAPGRSPAAAGSGARVTRSGSGASGLAPADRAGPAPPDPGAAGGSP